MAREYGRMFGTFWTSETIRAMSDDGKLLAAYLLSCSHNTIAGVFRLPDGYASEDLGWAPARIQAAFAEHVRAKFAIRCPVTKWVWVVKHFDWNPPENPNQRKAASKVALSVPIECTWRGAFRNACRTVLELPEDGSENPSETVAELFATTVANQDQEQKQKQEQKQEQKTLLSDAHAPDEPAAGSGKAARRPRDTVLTAIQAERFERFYAAYPRRESRGDAEKAWKVIDPDDALVERMVTAIDEQRLAQRRANPDEARFVPLPATWLRDKRWKDEVSQAGARREVAL